jgi:uncharacterized protein YndB with AHSA1/START domain
VVVGSVSAGTRTVVSVVTRARYEDVWRALRDPAEIARWFGWDYEGLHEEVDTFFVKQAVEGVDAEHHRALTMKNGDRLALVVEGEKTRITVTRRTHEALDRHESYDGLYDAVDEGWISFVHQLRFYLEKHPGVGRRTLSALGLPMGPRNDSLLDRLGLLAVRGTPVGAAYSATRPPDNRPMGGQIWYRTELQTGMTLASEFGEALLIIARVPSGTRPPHGEVNLVLNTDGLDDADFAGVQERWDRWLEFGRSRRAG